MLAFQGALIPTRSSMPFTAATALPAMRHELVAPSTFTCRLPLLLALVLDYYGSTCRKGLRLLSLQALVTARGITHNMA